jgi:hypothetical protein
MTAFIKTHIHNGIVIPDIRFIHEAKALLDAGGILVRISNPARETESQLTKYDLAQLLSSSNDYINVDNILNNTGTVPELYINIETLLESLVKKKSPPELQLPSSPNYSYTPLGCDNGSNVVALGWLVGDCKQSPCTINRNPTVDTSNASMFI